MTKLEAAHTKATCAVSYISPISVLTMVDCQNLPTVHLNKAAQRKLCVLDPQLLRPLKGDPLQNENRQAQTSDRESQTSAVWKQQAVQTL